MPSEYRPQFTVYHPEMDKLLFWTKAVTIAPAGESYVFVWGDKLAQMTDFRHMLLTMNHFQDIETDPRRLNFLIRAMLKFLKGTDVWEEIMLIPIDRGTSTNGKDKTIIDDLDFVKAIKAA